MSGGPPTARSVSTAAAGSSAPVARPSLLTKPLPSGDRTIHASTFGHLFAQVVTLAQGKSQSIGELERRLDALGADVGARFLELCFARDKAGKRETKLVNLLQYISTSLWKTLFGKKADGIERNKEHDNIYMLRDNDPLTNRFISVPRDYSPLNCASFMGGILRGALTSAGFTCTVATHTVALTETTEQTVFVMEFAAECLNRDI